MEYLATAYKRFSAEFPEISDSYDELAKLCHEEGPLDPKARRLVKLGIAIGRSSEGAVRSHTRRALGEGITEEEIRHAVLLSLTTVGLPAMVAAFKWADEVIDRKQP